MKTTRCGRQACERALRERQERRTIHSATSPSAARRLIRSHLRSPLTGFAWSVGARPGGIVVGFVFGNYLYARPVPQETVNGRIRDSLVMRGRIVPRQDGGCDLYLSIRPPRLFRVVGTILVATASALCLAGYFETMAVGFLLAAVVLTGGWLAKASIRRTHQGIEPSEWALFGDWASKVEMDLRSGLSQHL
jgi:hypothetical protein